MTMGRSKSKKLIVPGKSKLKKDPGIPKLPNLKVRQDARQRRHPPNVGGSQDDPDAVMASEPTLSTLAMMASEAEASFSQDPSSSTQARTKEQARKFYLKMLHKVIDESDIVILVLDARDPEGCRSRLVEEEVRRRETEGKKLVFILNKVDLIPRTNAQEWLKYLRHSTPTLPFLSPSGAQHQRTHISSSTAPALLKLLKAYKPKSGSVTVGVVGYPNVGKSSLINSLKRSKVCAVAAQPGHTKDLQSITLDRGMKIVDSPGVVFDDDNDEVKGQRKGSVLLRNVVKVEDVEDPIAVVEEILMRTPRETVQKIYNLPEFANTLEFLTMLALTSGKLLKGGTPDVTGAARHVLADWNHQKIPYFSVPPTLHPSMIPSSTQGEIAPGAENVGQAQILNTLSKPFQLEGLFDAADAGAFGGASKDVDMDEDDDGDVFYDAMEVVDDEPAPASRRTSLKRPRSPTPSPTLDRDQTMDIEEQVPTTTHTPKRQRKSKFVPSYDDAPTELHMSKNNPLNRRVLKQTRKRERRAEQMRIKAQGSAGQMDIDGEGLEFTFMA